MSRLNPGYFTSFSTFLISSTVIIKNWKNRASRNKWFVASRRSLKDSASLKTVFNSLRNGSPCKERKPYTFNRRSARCLTVMNYKNSPFALCIFWFAALFVVHSLALPLRGQEIDIGRVEVQGDARVVPVLIESNQPKLKELAERAFSAHGGFRVVRDRSSAAFVFQFQGGTGNRVELGIVSGSGSFREVVTGNNPSNALYRAADLAVRKTTGQPGFFAGKLAFIADRSGAPEVYVSDLFLGEVRRLTRDNSDSLGPRWAPDGRKLLYTSYYRSGFPDIFQIDTVSNQRTPFVSVRGTNTGARYSPDGRQVAMVLSGSGNPEIYITNAEGKQPRRLTRTEAVQSSPSWSPDGSRIVFTSDRNGRPQLFTMRASGGEMRRIPTNISGNCTEPDWNPRDENLIAFTAAVSGRFAIALYDFKKRESRFLTDGPDDAVAPRWTSDGRHLLYTSRTSKTGRLMLLDTETGKSTRLSSDRMGKASHADFWIER